MFALLSCAACRQKKAAFTQSSVRGRIRRLASPERAICSDCAQGKGAYRSAYPDEERREEDVPPLYPFAEEMQLGPAPVMDMQPRRTRTHKYVPLLTQISRRLVVENAEDGYRPKQKTVRGLQGRNFSLDYVTRAEPRLFREE